MLDGSIITISGGIAEGDGTDIYSNIAKVDRLLYEAKTTGKNKIIG